MQEVLSLVESAPKATRGILVQAFIPLSVSLPAVLSPLASGGALDVCALKLAAHT